MTEWIYIPVYMYVVRKILWVQVLVQTFNNVEIYIFQGVLEYLTTHPNTVLDPQFSPGQTSEVFGISQESVKRRLHHDRYLISSRLLLCKLTYLF